MSTQCFCYPEVENCEHCNRARLWVEREILCRANELAELRDENDTGIYDVAENLTAVICPVCGEEQYDINETTCDLCGAEDIDD
jgi:hypothetical protein